VKDLNNNLKPALKKKYQNLIIITDHTEVNSHAKALPHGTMIKWFRLHFDDHVINNPRFAQSIVAITPSIFRWVGVKVKFFPRIAHAARLLHKIKNQQTQITF